MIAYAWPHTLIIPPHLRKSFAIGCELFTEGLYWERHEAWESVWLRLNRGHLKIAMQLLIQLAACALLLQQNRHKGFHRKHRQANLKLEGLWYLGIRQIGSFSIKRLFILQDRMNAIAEKRDCLASITPCFQHR